MLWWTTEKNCSSRLDELDEEVAKLKRMVQEKDLDWLELRSRCKRLLDRTEKAAKSNGTGNLEVADQVATGNVLSTATGRLLSPHQLEVQQQILKRRAGGGI